MPWTPFQRNLCSGLALAASTVVVYFNPDLELKSQWQRDQLRKLESVPVTFRYPDTEHQDQFTMAEIALLSYHNHKTDKNHRKTGILNDIAESLSDFHQDIRDVTIALDFSANVPCTCRADHAVYHVTIHQPDGTLDTTLGQTACAPDTTKPLTGFANFVNDMRTLYQEQAQVKEYWHDMPPRPRTNHEKISELLFAHLKPKRYQSPQQ